MDIDLKVRIQGEKRWHERCKNGKNFCCGKCYFERYVLWHIPE